MKKLFILSINILCCIVLNAQTVAINSADRKIVQGAAGFPASKHITYSVLNCNPGRITGVSYTNSNNGSASPSEFAISGFGFAIPGNSSSFLLTFNNPAVMLKKDETIVLRFMLSLTDTIIFNTDTITLAAVPQVPKHPRWYKDKTNTLKYEFNQFTDFLGFDNQKPNGLLQQELIIKLPLVKKMSGKKTDPKVYLQPLRSIVFNALFNRIDKSNTSQNYPVGTSLPNDPNDINKIDSIRPYLTTLDIFKYSNLQLGFKFNFLTLHIGNFRLSTAYGFNVLRNKPFYADTLKFRTNTFTKDDVRSVYSFVHKLELFGNSAAPIDKKLSVAFNAGVMLIGLKDSYYQQFDAAVVDPVDRSTLLLSASDARTKRKAKPVWYFSGTISKNWGKKNENTVFFRTNYFYQTGKYSRYGGSSDLSSFDPKKFYKTSFHNHFLQLQLGLALDLNKFLGVKDEE